MSMVYYVGDVISHNLRTDKYRICKLGGRVVRVTCHELPLVKVKRSKVKVTVSRNVSGARTLQFGCGWSLSHQIQTYHHEGNVKNCRSNKPEVEMWRTFSIGPTRCKWSTENVPKSLKKIGTRDWVGLCRPRYLGPRVHTKRYLNRCYRFCRVHGHDQQSNRMTWLRHCDCVNN